MAKRPTGYKRKGGLVDSGAECGLTPDELDQYAQNWYLQQQIQQCSDRTIQARRSIMTKLAWFLRHRGYAACGTAELREFLAYIVAGHEKDGGRWGFARATKPVSARTLYTYSTDVRTFFRYVVSQGRLSSSPMDAIPPVKHREDQIQPFTDDQFLALLDAARHGSNPLRDEALLLFFLDTGARLSEVAGLRLCDVDMHDRQARVLGKGDKERTIFFQPPTLQALWRYLQDAHGPRPDPNSPLFLADRGIRPGAGLTADGIAKIIHRLGKAAGLTAVRCSPHTLRHTFAVNYIRAGGNAFALQQMLGHTSLAITNRYVALAQADMAEQHRQYSPVQRLLSGGRRGRGR